MTREVHNMIMLDKAIVAFLEWDQLEGTTVTHYDSDGLRTGETVYCHHGNNADNYCADCYFECAELNSNILVYGGIPFV